MKPGEALALFVFWPILVIVLLLGVIGFYETLFDVVLAGGIGVLALVGMIQAERWTD